MSKARVAGFGLSLDGFSAGIEQAVPITMGFGTTIYGLLALLSNSNKADFSSTETDVDNAWNRKLAVDKCCCVSQHRTGETSYKRAFGWGEGEIRDST